MTEKVFGHLPVRLAGRELPSSYATLIELIPADAKFVLDIGCGSAPMQRLIAATRPTCAYVGVDFSLDELRKAGENAWVIAGRSQAIPLADAKFDVVISHMALMLMDETPRVVSEMARLLPEGGLLAAIVPAARPESAAFDSYLQLLREELAAMSAPAPRLGGGGWRDPNAILTTLGAHFQDFQFDYVELEEHLEPCAAWQSFLKMYDLFHLDASARERIRTQWLEQSRNWVDSHGCVTVPLRLLRLSCRRGETGG